MVDDLLSLAAPELVLDTVLAPEWELELLQWLQVPSLVHCFLCNASVYAWQLGMVLIYWFLAGAGSGRGTRTGTGSEEAKNMSYESSTASGARSGATGATGAGMSSGMTAGHTGGVTEGVRGLNITDRSGVSIANVWSSHCFRHTISCCNSDLQHCAYHAVW